MISIDNLRGEARENMRGVHYVALSFAWGCMASNLEGA
jgi:hypothetical protein